eukprot:symbB.v1.2.005860.t1/scaffold335.1/size242651/11
MGSAIRFEDVDRIFVLLCSAKASGDTANWGVLEGSSVRELLSRGVARGLAEQLKDHQKEAWKEPVSRGAPTVSSSSQRLQEQPAGPQFSDLAEMQEIIKMPMDLVAKAFNSTTSEDPDQVVLQTWDFAGQEMYYSMAHVFITAPGIYVLVVDLSAWLEAVTMPASMCSYGLPVELSDSLDFWLAAVLVHAPDARLIIVGSHDDLIPPDLSSLVRGRVNEYLQQRLDNPAFHSRLFVNEEEQLLFFPVDNSRSTDIAKQGLTRLRRILDQLALEAAEDAGWIPTRWAQFFNVITSIDGPAAASPSGRRRSAENEAILQKINSDLHCLQDTQIRFQETLRDSGGVDICRFLLWHGWPGPSDLESCLRLFHGLGQLLHFPGSPAVVLDPQWLLDAMAQVVGCPRVLQRNSHHAAALLQKGELSEELLHILWRDERFRGQEDTLRAFLEHFSLLVPVQSGASAGSWLVPSLLPKCHPQQWADDTGKAASLYFDFHGALRQLLPSLLPRLLAKLQRNEPTLRGKKLCQDFLAFSMDSIMVTLELTRLELGTPVARVNAIM